jgi:multimeric flavodoxin WrbA
MDTLILFGSARKNGETNRMVSYLTPLLEGSVTIVDAYRIKGISPCRDCRYCWNHPTCCIKDGMQDIYGLVESAQGIIIAAPVYFSSAPAPLKLIIDRFQPYWAKNCLKKQPWEKRKKGALLLAGGAASFENQFKGCEIQYADVFKALGVDSLGTVCMSDTDHRTLSTEEKTKDELVNLANLLNM